MAPAQPAQPGTGQPPYQATKDQEQTTGGKRSEMVYHCITTNPAYRAKSFEELRLEDSRIMKLENLGSLRRLSKFDAGKNKISHIEGLESLALLSQLSLEDNAIESLDGLLERLEIGVDRHAFSSPGARRLGEACVHGSYS